MDTPAPLVPQYANLGEQIRATMTLTLDGETEDGFSLFDIGPNANFDWSAFTSAQSKALFVKPTDTIAVDLTNIKVQVLVISTDVPIQVNYTQDTIARVTYVKPLVQPAVWFATAHSPSSQPTAIQRGISMLMGGDITTLSIQGLTAEGIVVGANVRIAMAGYRT